MPRPWHLATCFERVIKFSSLQPPKSGEIQIAIIGVETRQDTSNPEPKRRRVLVTLAVRAKSMLVPAFFLPGGGLPPTPPGALSRSGNVELARF